MTKMLKILWSLFQNLQFFGDKITKNFVFYDLQQKEMNKTKNLGIASDAIQYWIMSFLQP